MKTLISWMATAALILLLASCGKTDVTVEHQTPARLKIEQIVALIDQPFISLQTSFGGPDFVITDSLGQRKASFPLLDRESPNPNFICEVIEDQGRVGRIAIRAIKGNHGTYKNTFFYFDRLLSATYPLSKFYAVDADGGINNSNKTKDDLYVYLNYNNASGAAEEFEAQSTTILNFCFNELDKAFVISIDKK